MTTHKPRISDAIRKSRQTEARDRLDAFLGLISLCGLSYDDTADILGVAPQTVRQKTSGRRRVTEDELDVLDGVWGRIRRGNLDGLPDGCRRSARALTWSKDRADEIERDADVDDRDAPPLD